MEARRAERSFFGGRFARPTLLRAEQEKLEARITQAKEEVRRAMSLFNENLAGLAQTIIALQAELSRARQGAWATAGTIHHLQERLQTAERAYTELERQRKDLVLEPLREVEMAEVRLQDARRKSEIAVAAGEAGEALDRLRLSLGEAVMLAEARVEVNEAGLLEPERDRSGGE
jgi:chromosome segregation ATPase